MGIMITAFSVPLISQAPAYHCPPKNLLLTADQQETSRKILETAKRIQNLHHIRAEKKQSEEKINDVLHTINHHHQTARAFLSQAEEKEKNLFFEVDHLHYNHQKMEQKLNTIIDQKIHYEQSLTAIDQVVHQIELIQKSLTDKAFTISKEQEMTVYNLDITKKNTKLIQQHTYPLLAEQSILTQSFDDLLLKQKTLNEQAFTIYKKQEITNQSLDLVKKAQEVIKNQTYALKEDQKDISVRLHHTFLKKKEMNDHVTFLFKEQELTFDHFSSSEKIKETIEQQARAVQFDQSIIFQALSAAEQTKAMIEQEIKGIQTTQKETQIALDSAEQTKKEIYKKEKNIHLNQKVAEEALNSAEQTKTLLYQQVEFSKETPSQKQNFPSSSLCATQNNPITSQSLLRYLWSAVINKIMQPLVKRIAKLWTFIIHNLIDYAKHKK